MKTLLQPLITLSIILLCSMQVFSQGGNVGIGTINPSHPLHVETTASVSGSRAIYGLATASSGETYGVFGESDSEIGRGVYGLATAGSGATFGVLGESSSASGRGVFGLGFYGVQGQSNKTDGRGVFGLALNTGTTYGVWGESWSTSGTGVYGLADADSGTTYGVRGEVESPAGFAGFFTGAEGSRNYFQRAVGIGTLDPDGFLLAVNGSAAKTGGGEWSMFSDARLKHSIERVQPGMLDRVLQLKGYTFEYKEHAIEKRFALPGRQFGLIAQEVLEVFPEWVDSDDDGYLFVTVRSLTAIMVESLRELRDEKDAEIRQLRDEKDATIAGLKAENLALSARLLKLEVNVEKLLQQQELEYAQNE